MDSISFSHDPISGFVSIVVPTYRKERFIGETLASIGTQTYPHWELIVVEDGSTGPTEQIVADFARRHPQHRVEYSRNDRNRGASHSRNVAFAKSRGEFIACLDADDRWLPMHLERSVEHLRTSGCDLAYSSALVIEDQTDILLDLCGPKDDDRARFPESLFRRNYIAPSATVMRRQVLADVGSWNTEMKYCEDMEYWLRCIRAGKKFQLVGGCNCLYRKNHEGATTQRVCGMLQEFAEILARFIPMPGARHARLRRHVARAFRRAARAHAIFDPVRDSSGDPSQSLPLMYRAWQFEPYRLDHFIRMADYFVKNRRRATPPATSSTTEELPIRSAA